MSNAQRCAELDGKIEHHKRISSYVTDQLTLDGIAGLIKQMTAERPRAIPSKSSEGFRSIDQSVAAFPITL
ncbi:hypothetical protein [Bradyrhizobium sp. AUGA SZCCT0431]|uniref:hypothetical protein n=1 Tax=Bradyrhizobium sp. AUGA SZCCT0431 TaxID=2807674 RepID=UPI001BAA9654|nr:hypothetical protein [Bradyrhizobium sp. AUGA SZCCT0431]MBR1148529.1 hypothetical protein [Bradyrhizobium sp. AUGA SZCCT0431]